MSVKLEALRWRHACRRPGASLGPSAKNILQCCQRADPGHRPDGQREDCQGEAGSSEFLTSPASDRSQEGFRKQ